MKDIAKAPCKDFSPFEGAPDVCQSCGHLAGEHPRGGLPEEVSAALWRVLFTYGGIPGGFGGFHIDEYHTRELTAHMAECGIDWKHTENPHLQDFTFTADTFAEPERTEIMAGELWCRCRKYTMTTVAIQNRTLGQLVWMAAHIDDHPGEGTR